jgi:drug/metabolite transporter (DMT)-like permease
MSLKRFLLVGYIILMTLIFSTVFILSQFIIPPLNTFTYYFIRTGIGAIFLLIVLKFKGLLSQCLLFFKENIRKILFFTLVTNMGAILLIFAGTPYTSASNQTVVQNFSLVTVVFLNFILYRKIPHKNIAIAVVLNVIGMFLVLSPIDISSNPMLIGDLLTIAGVAVGAYSSIYQKKNLIDKTNPLILTFAMCIFPASFLFILLSIFSGPLQFSSILLLDGTQWLIMVWFGIMIAALGYSIVNAIYSFKGVTPEIMGIFSSLNPIAGVILSVIVFQEDVMIWNLIGMILVLTSTFIAQMMSKNQSNPHLPKIERETSSSEQI